MPPIARLLLFAEYIASACKKYRINIVNLRGNIPTNGEAFGRAEKMERRLPGNYIYHFSMVRSALGYAQRSKCTCGGPPMEKKHAHQQDIGR
jgi:hypothetical protein